MFLLSTVLASGCQNTPEEQQTSADTSESSPTDDSSSPTGTATTNVTTSAATSAATGGTSDGAATGRGDTASASDSAQTGRETTASSGSPELPDPVGEGTLIADTTPDFMASIEEGTTPNDVISYGGTDPTKGAWTSATMSSEVYDPADFVEFSRRSYGVSGFETHGFTHRQGNVVPWIGKDCGRVQASPSLPVIRRWTSSFDGSVRLTGTVGMDTEHQSLGGTGTRVRLYVDGAEVYARDLVGTDVTQYNFDVPPMEVETSTVIDSVIMPIDPSSRIANLTIQIYEL